MCEPRSDAEGRCAVSDVRARAGTIMRMAGNIAAGLIGGGQLPEAAFAAEVERISVDMAFSMVRRIEDRLQAEADRTAP